MAIGKVKKQSWEAFYIHGSILKWQADGSTETVVLATSTVIAENAEGVDVSDTFLDQTSKALSSDPNGDFDDNMLSIRPLSEGGVEADSPFKVTFKIITSAGNYYEVDVRVIVKEE
jgi:hypothetical protein